jgi:uncharacterized spore protein YtfJ
MEDIMENIIDILEQIAETLSDTAKSDVVVGKEVELGSAKIVPLSRVSIGFGGGGGEGDQQFGHRKEKMFGRHGAKGIGLGSGGGAKVRPVGVIVFTEDGVRVQEIPDKKGPFDKVFDKIPDIIEFARKHK